MKQEKKESPPLSFLENVMFLIGVPKKAPRESKCFKCGTHDNVIDLGDDTFICQYHWDTHVPSYDV